MSTKIEKEICLDEIRNCFSKLEEKNLNKKKQKIIESWIRENKKRLKELGHKKTITKKSLQNEN